MVGVPMHRVLGTQRVEVGVGVVTHVGRQQIVVNHLRIPPPWLASRAVARDPYEILGIARDATLAEAKAAYRTLAELFHPDRLGSVRDEVRAEGVRRMREANEAMRAVRATLGRPLRASGHEQAAEPKRKRPPAPASRRRTATVDDAGIPERPGAVGVGKKAPGPSDAVTAAMARDYDVVLRTAGAVTLQVRWSGRHAAATLAALRNGHHIDGIIHQVEWGSYEVELDGGATRRLLCSVLGDDEWRGDPVEVMRGEVRGSTLALGDVLDLLDDALRYSVLADVY